MKLQLEYSCTQAEQEEAQTLQLRQTFGRGSKWLTRLVLFGLLALAHGVAYLRVQREMSPKERPWFIGLVLVIFIAIRILKSITRNKTVSLVRLEASEREVVLQCNGARTAMPWASFSQCLESANLFVLVNRPKSLLFLVPKRAFPDETAQEWFRVQANPPQSVAPAESEAALVPGRFVTGQGIALSWQPKYRDYLVRHATSWRLKGVLLVILALVVGLTLFSPPPPGAVNSPLKTMLIMVPSICLMGMAMLPIVSFLYWRAERQYLAPRHLVLNEHGIDYASRDGEGRLPWSTYRYYWENRWCFFVWHPRGSAWYMFPKRDFASASEVDQARRLLQAHLKRSRWFYH